MRSSLFAVLLIACSAASAEAQVSVSPLVLETTPGAVTLGNGGAAPVRVTAELVDVEQLPAGSYRYMPAGEGARSCGSRVRLGTVPSVIGAQSEVRVGLTVAEGATCWGAIRFGFAMGADPARHFVLVRFYRVGEGAERVAEITSLAWRAEAGKGGIEIAVRSGGTAPVRPEGRIELRRADGDVAATVLVPDFGLHPGVARSLWVALPEGVAPGDYVALAILDIGDADPIAAQSVIQIPGQ